MGIFNNIFGGKNPIDEKFENINILRTTMRQNEAVIQTRNLISELMQKPSLLNGMKEIGAQYQNLGTRQKVWII